MINKTIISLLCSVVTSQLAFSAERDWSDVAFLKPTYLKVSVDTFDDPVSVKYGKVELGHEKKPYFRLLESPWATYLNPEVTKEEYLSYFYGDDEIKKKKRSEALKRAKESYPSREAILKTAYAKRYGVLYVKGASLVSFQGKVYCILDYTYDKDAPKGETIAVFGILDAGKWKLLDKRPDFLDYGPMPWASSYDLLKAARTGYMLYDAGSNSFKPVSVEND